MDMSQRPKIGYASIVDEQKWKIMYNYCDGQKLKIMHNYCEQK